MPPASLQNCPRAEALDADDEGAKGRGGGLGGRYGEGGRSWREWDKDRGRLLMPLTQMKHMHISTPSSTLSRWWPAADASLSIQDLSQSPTASGSIAGASVPQTGYILGVAFWLIDLPIGPAGREGEDWRKLHCPRDLLCSQLKTAVSATTAAITFKQFFPYLRDPDARCSVSHPLRPTFHTALRKLSTYESASTFARPSSR
ncbi:hypothetical protein B0H19DRAFT_1121660 [Mycena capillaripes]|nr:hypothetical protein B0H19DRAFT_1121660 [Mycena capillaripes]